MIPTESSARPYDELVVVCGPPRSGTTWLQRELCSARGTFRFMPECSLVTQQVELYHRTLRYCDPQRFAAYFGDREFLLAYFRANIARLIDRAAMLNQTGDARILVIKDPCLSLYLEDLGDLLPPHRLIVLVRNPLDVVASMKTVAGRRKERWRPAAVAGGLLQYYLRIGQHASRAGRDCLLLRYEDVVTGDRQALRDFLGDIRLADHVATDTTAVAARLDSRDPFFSEHYLRPTTSERIGAYRKTLSLSEIVRIETMYSGIMRDWNYRNVSASGTTRIALGLAKSLRTALRFFRRLAGRDRRPKDDRD